MTTDTGSNKGHQTEEKDHKREEYEKMLGRMSDCFAQHLGPLEDHANYYDSIQTAANYRSQELSVFAQRWKEFCEASDVKSEEQEEWCSFLRHMKSCMEDITKMIDDIRTKYNRQFRSYMKLYDETMKTLRETYDIRPTCPYEDNGVECRHVLEGKGECRHKLVPYENLEREKPVMSYIPENYSDASEKRP